MRIEDLRSEIRGDCARVAATIIWEDCARVPKELFFETTRNFAEALTCNPHAFLVGCVVPAMHYGEKRIRISEEICPELLNGLEINMRWLQHFSGGQYKPINIECIRSSTDIPALPKSRSGSFLSGGVDSLATLRKNRLDFPLDHPASIQDCIVVHGFDIGGTSRFGTESAVFDRALTILQEPVQDAEVTLISIRSNVRLLHDDVGFWMSYFHGAALASVAHSLSKRLTRVYIASSDDIPPIPAPWGSHPLLDANYGSYALQIRHDGLNLTRLDKVKLVADWDAALRNLRVCTENADSALNCGTCEKCIRTMLELLVVGKLEATDAFPSHYVDPDLLDSLPLRADEIPYYEVLVEPLSALGYQRLGKALQDRLVVFRKHLAWELEQDWKGAVKRIDRRLFKGAIYHSWKVLRPRLLTILHNDLKHR